MSMLDPRDREIEQLKARVAELGAKRAADITALDQHWLEKFRAETRRCSALHERLATLEAHLPRAAEEATIEARNQVRSEFSILLGAGPLEGPEEAAERLKARAFELEARLQIDPGGSDKIDELEQSNQFLRARVAELEAKRAADITALDQHWLEKFSAETRRCSTLHERLATLEAPPVVPEGWEVRKGASGYWQHDWIGGSYVGRPSVLRALAWAIEHNTRPPHASDGKETP